MLLFRRIQEFIADPADLLHRFFNIDPDPLMPAYNGRSKIAAVRNRKMIALIWQVRFTCIRDLDQFIREIREQELQQEAAGKVLQPLMRMRHIPVQGHVATEELFRFLDLPYAEPGMFVDGMLKKIGHLAVVRL